MPDHTSWWPMETAPLDQTEVLLRAPAETPKVFTAKYVGGEWVRSSSGRVAPNDSFFGDRPIAPTGWLPLPSVI